MIPTLLAGGDYGLLALRVALGLILIAHGWSKLRHFTTAADGLRGMGFRPARLWTALACAVELGGGLLIIAGLYTQPVASLVALQFLAIILKVKLSKGLVGGYEFDLLIFAAAAALMTVGAGGVSIDDTFHVIFY